MYSANLFLGFPVDSKYASLLDSVKSHFILNEEGSYLQEITHHNKRYLGKMVGNLSDLSSLELLESNIYSLLKKLIPHYPYEEIPLKLFSVLTP